MAAFGQKLLYSCKLVILGRSGCIRQSACIGEIGSIWANVVVFEESECIWLKSCIIPQKWLDFGKSGIIRGKWLYSGKAVVFEESGCIRKIGCIRAKWLYSSKMVVFRQSGCNWAKEFVLGQSGSISAELIVFVQSG